MNTLRFTPRAVRGLLCVVAAGAVLCLLPAAARAQVQTLYEWRDARGTVVYSQLPPEHAASGAVRVLRLPQLPAPERATAARVLVQSGPPAQPARRALEEADARVMRAIDALQQAERALRERQEPEAGERQGLANGHSRLTGAYFERLAQLQAQVDRQRVELREAYAARDALVR
ncbi:DUF4124 domain-containing protein [Caenimonas terrae]|uniref:DUF4124 domain-containing protein n=1 Tax=Caenimonas terrae TaxID=696074 RepID=A0ABW0NH78_9BURK